MVVHRSQEAGKPKQSSQQYTLLKGVTSWIALLLLLLVLLSLFPVILGNDPSSVFCIIHVPRKDWFLRRNQYNYYFNIQKNNKNLIRPTNHDSGEHGLQYHLAASIPKTNKPSNGCQQIMPPRRVKKRQGSSLSPLMKWDRRQQGNLPKWLQQRRVGPEVGSGRPEHKKSTWRGTTSV